MNTLTAVSPSCTEDAVFASGALVEEEIDKREPLWGPDGWK